MYKIWLNDIKHWTIKPVRIFHEYNFNFFRVSIGEDASLVVKQREVLNFIGRGEEWDEDVCPVKKLVRKDNGKVLETSLQENILLQVFLQRGVTPYPIEEAKIFTGQAIKTQRAEIANSGDAVKFVSSESEVINAFSIT